MDFHFFEELSKSDAELFLANFLSVESKAVDDMLLQAKSDGVSLIVGIHSIAPMFSWVLKKLQSIPKPADAALPDWITGADSYKRGLFAFDQPSSVLILRAAYFLGESFVKEYPQLHWGTGDRETALQNMPVIKKFKSNMEMAPILVTQNLLGRIHKKNASTHIIDTAIQTWMAKV